MVCDNNHTRVVCVRRGGDDAAFADFGSMNRYVGWPQCSYRTGAIAHFYYPSHFQVLLGMDVLSLYEINIARGEPSLKRLFSD